MTMTRPWRRITRHLLQILLTLGLTFTVCVPYSPPRTVPARAHTRVRPVRGTDQCVAVRSLVAVDDAPSGEVVRRQFDDDPVLGQDTDVVLPHLAADVSQDLVSVGELDPEHGVREGLDDPA